MNERHSGVAKSLTSDCTCHLNQMSRNFLLEITMLQVSLMPCTELNTADGQPLQRIAILGDFQELLKGVIIVVWLNKVYEVLF